MTDPKEYRIRRIELGNVSVQLVHREGQAILVDSGTATCAGKILNAMQEEGVAPAGLRLLILTHAHFDHAGSAARLKEICNCPVLVHVREKERLTAGYAPLPPGTRWKAKLLVGIGRSIAKWLGSYTGLVPDLLVEERFSLAEFGFPGQVIHTPGHTVGSVVVHLEGGELLAGDTFFGLEGKQRFPPFAEDQEALLDSWKKLRDLELTTIFPAHGKIFDAREFLSEFDQALLRYGKKNR